MYKCISGEAPLYLCDMFDLVNNIHERTTRSAVQNDLYVPKARTEYYRRSLAIQGPRIWNNLSADVRGSNSVAAFKYLCKRTQPLS